MLYQLLIGILVEGINMENFSLLAFLIKPVHCSLDSVLQLHPESSLRWKVQAAQQGRNLELGLKAESLVIHSAGAGP